MRIASAFEDVSRSMTGPSRCEVVSMTDSDLRDLLCLTMVAGVGPHTCRALLERYKSAGRALDASNASLRDVEGIGPKLAERIVRARKDHDADEELEFCRKAGVELFARGDAGYPPPLQ